MTVLWMTLAAVFAFGCFARMFPVAMTVGTVSYKPDKFMIFIVMFILVVVAGLRNNIGDTFFYMHAYEISEINWTYVMSNKDIGFGILQMLLQQITRDAQLLIFVTALITNILIVSVFYHYSKLIEISLYVYITSSLFIVSMNGIRQFLAAAIIFAASKFLFEGKWKAYLAVVLFASFFHFSALIMIPIYFFVRRKAWSWSTVLLLLSAVMIVIGFNEFSSVLFSLIENTQYGEYKTFDEGGSNFIRVAVNSVPLLFAFLGRKKLERICPYSNYLANLALLGVFFLIISTQNWIFARFGIYFSLYNVILISWVIGLFVKQQRTLIYYGVLFFYFLYFFYDNVVVKALQYRSDFL